MSSEKNTNRVAGGLKATINNPNASEEAKQSASERLENMSSMTGETGKATSGTTAPKTSRTSRKSRSQAEVVEDEYNEDALEKLATGTGVEKDEHSNRALGGYKATLNNPNTSKQAKQHAKEVLEAEETL